METNTMSQTVLNKIKDGSNVAMGITGSPSTTLEIVIDITEQTKTNRTLGQMVYVCVEEDGQNILVIGQIIEIETKNRWHEDPAFKGVIKRHGSLPHLSGAADNRIATISVQASYDLGKENPEGYILGTSPSTGVKVHKMNNEVMKTLMTVHRDSVTYIGKVYGTGVDLPFWFKHFDKDYSEKNEKEEIIYEERGARDAYHIGIFGKTGSGKTVTAAMTLLGYAKNKKNLSILVLDPQAQFSLDRDLLPSGASLKNEISKTMKYDCYNILEDIYLPGDDTELFADLLFSNGFIRQAFRLYNEEKMELAAEAISSYFDGRLEKPGFSLSNIADKIGLLREMLTRFTTPSGTNETRDGFTRYIMDIYGTRDSRNRLVRKLTDVLNSLDRDTVLQEKWSKTLELFSKNKATGNRKTPIEDIVKKVVDENGNFIVLDISPRQGDVENENLQARFVTLIEKAIVEAGARSYAKGNKGNALIVMDEAHRFISTDSTDDRIKELTKEIVDSVRTTRKYGIGYMFITQTIESLNEEIIRQMRIFGFGYGLTSGQELRKVSEVVNNPAAVKLYKSFIDPSSNGKFPFMFFGPISPLSFTGSPLFIEMYKDFNDFR
jgi:DNA helicase HerA-like ATPase